MSTIFGKIIRREVPADIVYEDDEVLAFRDVSPQAPVHILVIPKVELATLNDAGPEHQALLGKLLLVARDLAVREGIADAGYRTLINCNPGGGQSVYHVHLHLLGGRQMGWPPG